MSIRHHNSESMRQKGIRRKQQKILGKTSPEGKKVIEFMIDTGATAYEASKEVVPGPKKAREIAREIRYNGPLMEFAYNGRQLKMVPAMVLLSKANLRLEEFLDKDMICPKCDSEFEVNARNLLDAVKTVHASLKASGALSQYEAALSQDMGTIQTNKELVEEILRLETEEAVAAEED